jgi:hypothetical protein
LRRDETRNTVEKRCLAGTVRSDEASYASGRDREIDAVQRRNAIETAAEPGDFEQSRRAGLGQDRASSRKW